jgi:NADP-dependent 3-hydroxy acid dehydrogenase YdfG
MNQTTKNIIITGASSGIGKATAIRFANEGWQVCLVARRASLLQEILKELPPGKHLVCPGAYEDPDTAKQLGELIRSEWDSLNALVNNAGVFLAADILQSSLDKWRKPFDIMVNGAIAMTRLAVPLMKDSGRVNRKKSPGWLTF